MYNNKYLNIKGPNYLRAYSTIAALLTWPGCHCQSLFSNMVDSFNLLVTCRILKYESRMSILAAMTQYVIIIQSCENFQIHEIVESCLHIEYAQN